MTDSLFKTSTILTMFALFSFVGCSELAESNMEENSEEGAPVTFILESPSKNNTRGNKFNVFSVSSFTVYGFYGATQRWKGVNMVKDADGSWNSTSGALSWPSGNMNVFATIPAATTMGVKNVVMKRMAKEDDKTYFPKYFEYELPDSNKYQTDMAFSSAIDINQYTADGNVKFAPRTYLSYIQFNIRLMIQDIGVIVRSATIHQVRTTARIEFNQYYKEQATITVNDNEWGKITQVFGNDEPVDLEYNVTTKCSGDSVLMIQPQSTVATVSTGTVMYQGKSTKVYQPMADADAAHNSYIELDCQIKKDNGSGGFVYLTEDYSTWDSNPHWVKCYFPFSKKTWKSNTTNNVTIKFDIPYDVNGQPIELPEYTPTTNMEYSVTIEEWEDDTDEDNSLYIKFVDKN